MPVLEPATLSLAERYLTAEFVTLQRDGTPIAWPTTPMVRADGTILITTSVAFPQKAFNVRRDPRVALLFSSPVGTGLSDPAQMLIRGDAICPDDIYTGPEGDLGLFWKRIFARQPSSQQFVRPPMRAMLSWYFMRLLITITPRQVEFAAMPSPAPSRTDAALVGGDTINRFPSVVLAARNPHGDPVLSRLTVRAEPDHYRLHLPEGTGVTPGRASLLAHRHDEHLAAMHNAVVSGTLHGSDAGGWCLMPERLIEPVGRDSFAGRISAARNSRAAAHRYLRRRGLSRPSIPWADYQALVPKA